MTKRLIIISDTHNEHKQITLPEGDILIHCGDWTGNGYHKEIRQFFKWLYSQMHENIIFIAGNHDRSFETEPEFKNKILNQYRDSSFHYLENSGVMIEGIKFWGSPNQPEFCNWAFNYERNSIEAQQLWATIPLDTQILITHGPPKGVLDKSNHVYGGYPQEAGCEVLRDKIKELPNLSHHLFGHLHECYGLDTHSLAPTVCINASICNLQYKPVNAPIVINI